MQQRAADRICVHTELRDNAGNRGRMKNVRNARNPALVAVTLLGKAISGAYFLHIAVVVRGFENVLQLRIVLVMRYV